MPRRAKLALWASSSLLFLAGYMALGSVQAYGSALLGAALVVLALSPFAERLDRASPGYRLITKALTVAYCCFIPLTWINFGLLNAVIGLVIYIQFYTMLHQKEEKSYYHLFLMSFFLLLAACSMAPEASIGIVLAVFLGATIWAFFSLRVAYEAEESQSHVPADIVRFGEEPTKQLHDGRDPFDAGIAGYLFVIAILAFVITAGIFFFTPRIEAGVIGRSNGVLAVTAVPENVSLNSGQTIQEDPTPILRAEFPDEPGGRATVFPLYWRITSLPKYNGSGWDRAPLRKNGEAEMESRRRVRFQTEGFEASRPARRDAHLIHQVLYMDDVPTSGIPALDLVQRIFASGQPRNTKLAWDNNQDFTVTLAKEGSRQLHYEVWSEVDQLRPEDLRTAGSDYDLEEDDLDLLKEQHLLPDTLALVRTVTADANNNYDKVVALTNYLSGNAFTYSLRVPPLPADFAIDAFLNKTRTGHCELFASALALMVRSLEIPARVVSGYKGGEYEEGDNAYIVRRAMAHLWVEVLFPGYGWVKFDPSPQSDVGENMGLIARARMSISLAALKARMLWFRDVVGFQGNRVVDLNQLRYQFVNEVRQLQEKVGDAAASGAMARYAAGSALGAGVCVFLAWLLYHWLTGAEASRRSPLGHYTLTRDQVRAIKVFRGVRKKLRSAGIEIAGKTAEELLDALAMTDLAEKEAAEALLTAYNEARFGGRPMPGERLAQLLRSLRGLRLQRPRA